MMYKVEERYTNLMAAISHKCICLSCTLFIFSIPSFTQNVEAKKRNFSASLRGSSHSLDRQQTAAKRARLKLHKTRREVMHSVRKGLLIRVRPSSTLQLANVSYPYAHPKLHRLLNQLSKLYYNHCRAPLVITSLTRPIHEQPRNASRRSVHPAGLAADLRVPPPGCRKWLRTTLLNWESQGLVEATREKRPPHFHLVAMTHNLSTRQISQLGKHSTLKKNKRKKAHKTHRHNRYKKYRVRKGDSIWKLARKWRVSEQSIKRLNHLHSSRIDYGQILLVPHRS